MTKTYSIIVLLVLLPAACFTQTRKLPGKPAEIKNAVVEESSRSEATGRSLVQNTFRQDSLIASGLKQSSSQAARRRVAFFKGLYQGEKTYLSSLARPSLFKLNGGQASLVHYASQREGEYPVQSPSRYTQFSLNAGASLLGLPLRVNAFHSTAQIDFRQPMNRFQVSLDAKQLQRDLAQRIDGRIKSLEQQLNLKDFEELARLEKFYELGNLDSLKPDELERLLQVNQALDSLRGLEQLALKRLNDSLSVAGSMIRHQVDSLEALGQPRLNRKVSNYLEKEKLHAGQLRRWQQKKDSLQRLAPDLLALYKQLMALKKAKKQGQTDPKYYQLLQQQGLLPKHTGLLAYVKSFSLGTAYPTYTRYTLWNVPVTGLHVELQPGILNAAYSASKNLIPVPAMKTYARQLQAGRAGVGTREGNHLHFIFLHGMDDKSSFRGDTLIAGVLDTSFYDKPRKNYVLAAEGKVQWNQWLQTEGEVAHATTAMNLYAREISLAAITPLRQSNPSTDSGSVRSGYAVNITNTVALTKTTKIGFRLEQIGPGFYSLGSPFLRNDIAGYELRLEQQFWKRQVSIAPSCGKWRDNLAGLKPVTTLMDSYGFKGKVAFQKLPFVTADYKTTLMANPQGSTVIKLASITSGYGFQMRSVTAQSTLTLTSQESKTVHPEDAEPQNKQDASLQNIVFNQTLSFRNSLQLTGNVSLMQMHLSTLPQQWVTYGGSISFACFDRWHNTLSLSKGHTQQNGKKQDFGLESKVNVWKQGDIAVKLEDNLFQTQEQLHNYKAKSISLTFSGRF